MAKWFAGGFAVLVAVGAFLGIGGGKIDRLLHNHPWLVGFSVGLMIVVVVLGVLVPLFAAPGATSPISVGLVIVAGLLVMTSLGLLTWGAVTSARDQQRPKIEAVAIRSPTGLSVKGVVKATSVKSSEHVLLLVYGRSVTDRFADNRLHAGHQRRSDPAPIPSGQGDYIQLLLGARAGPDADGHVELPFEVSLGRGLYDQIEIHASRGEHDPDQTRTRCTDRTVELGCRSIWLPPTPQRPSVATTQAKGTFTSEVAMSDLAADDRVRVTVRRLDRHGHLDYALATATLAPDGDGTAKGKVVFVLPANARRACVRAKLVPAGATDDARATTAERSGCAGGRYSAVGLVRRSAS